MIAPAGVLADLRMSMDSHQQERAVVAEGLCRLYQMGRTQVCALDGIDLSIESGEFASVVGVSGSGKSTLLHLIGGLDTPSGGRILVDGEELHAMSEQQKSTFRRRKVGFVFQAFHLVPSLSARANVELSLTIRGIYGEERRRLTGEALDRVGLSGRTEHRPGQLSGGEQQRVAIARAIVHQPPLLLADEPTGNLDSENALSLVELMSEINRDSQTTVVMVTHDEELARHHSGRLLRLRDGRLTGEEVLS